MSGGFNPINIVSTAALAAATGGTSLIVQAAIRAVITAVVQQVIQQVGQQLGLPPQVINAAQTAFSATSGNAGGVAGGLGGGVAGLAGGFDLRSALSNLGSVANLSPTQIGQITRAAEKSEARIAMAMLKQGIREVEQDTLSQIASQQNGDLSKRLARGKAGSGADAEGLPAGGSFLRTIAAALGAALDSKMDEMKDLAGKIEQQVASNEKLAGDTSKEGAQNFQAASQKLGSYNSMFQAVSQEISILQNVISSTLKTVGEAQSTLARAKQ